MNRRRKETDPSTRGEPFEPLINTNNRQPFIGHRGHRTPAQLNHRLFLQQLPLSIIDDETLQLIQVLQLHKVLDHTASATGSAALLRSLIQPSVDLQTIRNKQDALREIASNDKLRGALQDYVHEYSNGESALYKFFNKGLYAMFPYRDVNGAKRSAANMTRLLPDLPPPASDYIRALMSQLQTYKGSSIDQMMTGSIYKTLGGLQPGERLGLLTPKQKFISRRFTHWMLAGPAVALMPYLPGQLGFELSVSPLMAPIGIVWTGAYAFYSMFVKPVKDTGNVIEPLRRKCIGDPLFSNAVDAIGMLDELLSLHQFASEMPHATTLPQVADKDHHFFEASGLKNPVIAKDQTDFVPNTVRMNGTRLTFISGPNSGGKTTICKSIVHNQLLAQMGAYVLAEWATVNLADMIRYQAPKFDGLQDDEGRFGTELSRTRDIFYSTSPKSLVILDELAEGTTYEERLHESYGILNDFHTIGNNTVLVTHNHSLVDRFMEEQKGQCLMAAFDQGVPTYKIVPGISRVSHADRIVKKINFSAEDRRRYLKAKGYL